MYLTIYYFALFVLLVSQSAKHIFGGDSSEFSLISKIWGIPHPPGYPAYSFLSNIIARVVPFYTTTWRLSLISSVATVLTSYFIYRLLKELKISLPIALISATLYIFLFPVWTYSIVPEVFALNNFLIILTTYLVFNIGTTKNIYLLYLISFLIGLQISHHHIFVLFIPGWIYLSSKNKLSKILKTLSKKQILVLIIAFFAGLLFYLYPPVVSSLGTVSDWENAKTFEGFFRLITRTMYGSFKAYSTSSPDILNQLFNIFSFFVFVFQDFRILGVIFILFGVYFLKKTNTVFLKFITISLLLHLLFFFYTNFFLTYSFTIGMFERFFISSYLLLIFLLSFGIEGAFTHIKKIIKNLSTKKQIIKIGGYFIYCIAIIYVCIVALQNYRTIKYIKDLTVFETYGKNLLNTAPQNALIQIGRDNSYFPAAYMYFAEKLRPDIKFIFLTILLKPHYQEQLKKQYPSLVLTNKLNKSPSSMIDFLNQNNQYGIFFETQVATDSWRPYGLLWKYYKNSEEMKKDEKNLLAQNKRLWNTVYTIPKLNKELKNILHLEDVQEQYITAYLNYSRLLTATNNIEEAEKVVRSIYYDYKNDMLTKTIFMNILVIQKKCSEAKTLLYDFSIKKVSTSIDLIDAYKNYFSVCDNKSPLLKTLEKQYVLLKKN